jgi:dipeptidyl-peptidase-4
MRAGFRFTRLALTLFAAVATMSSAVSQHASAADDLLARYSATGRFRFGAPSGFAFTPDGREVLFLRSGPRDRVNALWSVDVRSGAERRLLTSEELLGGATETLTPAEQARRERLRSTVRGIAAFELSRDGARLLVPLSGRLFVVERRTGKVRELAPDAPPAGDAHFSPDGASIACVRGGDLCVVDVASGASRTVIAHESGTIGWGSPEFVAQEELGRYAGWWWSPDSKSLLAQRTDETNVERMRISDPFRPESPPQEWAYPRPGRANADVRLAIVPAAGGTPRFLEWDRARWPYLCTARWPEKSGPVIEVMGRTQQEEAVLAADPATGATRVLFMERDTSWLNLHPGVPRPLGAGGLLWIAERDDSGPWLERRDAAADAAPVRLTPPGLRVAELLAVDEAANTAWVLASDDPRESHVWRVAITGEPHVERLGADAGEEAATFATAGGLHVRALRAARGPSRWRIEDGSGRPKGEVRSVAEAPPEVPNVEYAIMGTDSLRVAIVRPRAFDRNRRYPVIDVAYGGPHYVQVSRAAGPMMMSQWLADQGFIVVNIDGRGTPRRGRTWERAIRGDLIGPALADHVTALRELCGAHPEMDVARVGVTGWSFGGYFSVLAVERAPETYRAALAGAPVVDWRDYDTAYTERYLGLLQAESLAYARSSALTDAAKLSRPLLVLHGTADDNVYFFHSLKLADALNRANRSWSLLPFPGQTHGVSDVAQVRQEYGRMVEFFRQWLGVPGDAAPPQP